MVKTHRKKIAPFQKFGDSDFSSEESFCQEFLTQVSRALESEDWLDSTVKTFSVLSRHITDVRRSKNNFND